MVSKPEMTHRRLGVVDVQYGPGWIWELFLSEIKYYFSDFLLLA